MLTCGECGDRLECFELEWYCPSCLRAELLRGVAAADEEAAALNLMAPPPEFPPPPAGDEAPF